jgi:hypothetical protein
MNHNGTILLPGLLPAQRQMRLTGEKTLDGGFRLVLCKGDTRENIDLTPQQTVEMAVGMLRSQGIEIGIAPGG